MPKDLPYYGFGEPNSIIVVYMEPLGEASAAERVLEDPETLHDEEQRPTQWQFTLNPKPAWGLGFRVTASTNIRKPDGFKPPQRNPPPNKTQPAL